MSRHSLSDNFSLKGIWWLPKTPEQSVPGIVSFDDEGINLELFGLLTSRSSDSLSPKIILGWAEGKLVTLYEAFATQYPGNLSLINSQEEAPRLRRCTFTVLYMFIGAHFKSEAELQFTSLKANITHLEEWMGPEHFPFESDEGDNTHIVTYTYPKAREMRVNAKESIVSIDSSFSPTGGSFKTMELKHDALVAIAPDEQQDLTWYESVLRNCMYILTLLVGRPVHPRWIEAHLEGEFIPFRFVDGIMKAWQRYSTHR